MIQQNLIKQAADYLKITTEEFTKRMSNTQPTIQKDWAEKKSIIDFYKDTDAYIYELVLFNNEYRLKTLLYPVLNLKGKTILDYGAGIGIVPILLAEHNTTYYYDLPGKTQEFAKYINSKSTHKTIFIDDEEDVFTRPYDFISCVDVLEHLENPMEVVKKITENLKPGTLFLTTGLDFSVGKHIPMHLEKNREYRDEYNKYMPKHYSLVFFHVTRNEWIYLWVKKTNDKGSEE